MVDFKTLREKAEKVAAAHQEHADALGEKIDAESAALELGIEAVRPALSAICSNFVIKHVVDYFTENVNEENYSQRAVLLAGGPLPINEVEVTETKKSRALLLNEAGELIEVVFDNFDHPEQAYGYHGDAGTFREPRQIAAAGKWKIEDLLEALSTAVDRQDKGKLTEKARSHRERAERLRAMSVLAAPPSRTEGATTGAAREERGEPAGAPRPRIEQGQPGAARPRGEPGAGEPRRRIEPGQPGAARRRIEQGQPGAARQRREPGAIDPKPRTHDLDPSKK